MFQQQQIPASKQVEQLTQALAQALVEKADAEAKVKDADLRATAIRNVLAGIQLGQQLQTEIDAEAKQAAEAKPAE